MDRVFSEHKSYNDTSTESPVTEGKASSSGRLNVREVMNETLVGYNRHTSLVALHSASKEYSKRIAQNSSN